MSSPKSFPEPSKRATRFFKFLCNDQFYEELQGDLEERYFLNCERNGLAQARRIYNKEVLKMLRPSVIKKVKTQYRLNRTAMLKNYTLVATRNIFRNKLFSAINILSLGVSMTIGLLAITFMSEIHSYDTFHEKKNRVYNVANTLTRVGKAPQKFASSSVLVGKQLADGHDGIEAVAIIHKALFGNLHFHDKITRIKGFYGNTSFFDVFTFPIIHGDRRSVLDKPNAIVLTQETAMRLFGRTDVVGEIIQHSSKDQYQVTGVTKNPPKNSHIQFHAIASLKTLEAKTVSALDDWTSMYNNYIYVLLKKGYNPKQMQQDLDLLASRENVKSRGDHIALELELLDTVFFRDKKANPIGNTIARDQIIPIVVLAIIVVLSACFNFTNLSIARNFKRAKEIGVRRIVGARRSQLVAQFVLEAVFISLIGLLLAIFLFTLIRPQFLAFNPYIQETVSLKLSVKEYFYFLTFAIMVGIMSGILPGLLLTKLRTASILKGVGSIKLTAGVSIRKALVGLQFMLAVGLFVLVTLTSKQYHFSLNYDLGFTIENVLNISVPNVDIDPLKNAFSKIPEVAGVSTSDFIIGTNQATRSGHVRFNRTPDSVFTRCFDIGSDYLENMGHEIIAGNTFSRELRKGKAVVNEMLVKSLGIQSIQDAIGQMISYRGKKMAIIGVVKDFQQGTINNPIKPTILLSGNYRHNLIQIKVATNDMTSTLTKLEKAWSTVNMDHPFNADFYSEAIKKAYSNISESVRTYGALSGMAIFISILGILGMAVYATESRIQELAIRKVLGATMSNITLLLGKNLLIMFLISALIAIPLAYYVFRQVIIPNAVYQVKVGLWELSSAMLLSIVALAITGYQALKAARSNPTENLQNE